MSAILKSPLSVSDDHSTALLRRSAVAARERGDIKLSNVLYREILCRYPEDREARIALQVPAPRRPEVAARPLARVAEPPLYLTTLVRRATALHALGRSSEALEVCDTAIATAPRRADAYLLRGTIQRELGRFEAALESFQTALVQRDDPKAKFALGCLYLLTGDLAQGWPLYDQNLSTHCATNLAPARANSRALWDGEADLRGQRLHLYQDQDIWETLQFARFALQVQARGVSVTLSVQDSIRPLLQSLSSTIEILPAGLAPQAFDVQCALSALPGILATTQETIPDEVRYLAADPARIRRWRERLGSKGFKIGLSWRKDPLAEGGRSFPAQLLRSLATLDGIRLISLQGGLDDEQLASIPQGMVVESFDELMCGPDGFEDTAAVIECVDLVITADSSVAHLCGSLGARTWLMLPMVPDWCWLLERQDSPWYPTLRLFRQSAERDFGSALQDLALELRALLKLRAAPTPAVAPVPAQPRIVESGRISCEFLLASLPSDARRPAAPVSDGAAEHPVLVAMPTLVSGLLVALICTEVVYAARSMWQHRAPVAGQSTRVTPKFDEIDIGPIVEAHLFGQAPDAPDPALPTATDLALTATIASDDPGRGLAIIGGEGKSRLYAVGRNIGEVLLHAVYKDRVVIERNGQLESLFLPRERSGETLVVMNPLPPSAPAVSAPQPASLIDKLMDSFVVTDIAGNMVGVRVEPIKDRPGFARSGLMGGDVVIAFNGQRIDNDGALNAWRQASNGATLTVQRHGADKDLVLNLAD